MDDKKNIFSQMANFLYKDETLKSAYIRGCADCICLMRNMMDATVKINDIISQEDLTNDVKAMNVIVHKQRTLTEVDVALCKTMDKPIGACNFSKRTTNILAKYEIKTVKDLLEKFDNKNLSRMRGFGRKCIAEVTEFLNDNHLYFGMMDEPVIMEKYTIYKWT